jgi:hypothetical protein
MRYLRHDDKTATTTTTTTKKKRNATSYHHSKQLIKETSKQYFLRLLCIIAGITLRAKALNTYCDVT